MSDITVMREELPPARGPRRHLLSIEDLTREDVERLLATARSFENALEREMKKLPTLRGRTVVNLFFESSTRTSSSFELAAKRLSADVMSIKAAGSSVRRRCCRVGSRQWAARRPPRLRRSVRRTSSTSCACSASACRKGRITSPPCGSTRLAGA